MFVSKCQEEPTEEKVLSSCKKLLDSGPTPEDPVLSFLKRLVDT